MTQMPPVHGTPLQQSPSLAQSWPYCAQPEEGAPAPPATSTVPAVPAELLAPPLSPTPPEPPVPVPPVVHVPAVDPGSRWHRPPGQQSALMVQLPPPGTQAPPVLQCSAPWLSGTQGALSQQSAAEAHTSPPT